MRLSIIIPSYNEADNIEKTVRSLEASRAQGHEVILVDGGSSDDTVKRAKPYVDKVVRCRRGRANQMNCGAKVAKGEVLWFLHADTLPPDNVELIILHGLRLTGKHWGRFNVQLSGKNKRFRVVERMINLRSKVTGIATGDQGIFVTKGLFEKVSGFPDVPIMEDVEITRKLKRISRPLCLKDWLVTSSRRWEENGINRTIMLMWFLRFAHAIGASPETLKRYYRYTRNS